MVDSCHSPDEKYSIEAQVLNVGDNEEASDKYSPRQLQICATKRVSRRVDRRD
jgi:hypothetical protein